MGICLLVCVSVVARQQFVKYKNTVVITITTVVDVF